MRQLNKLKHSEEWTEPTKALPKKTPETLTALLVWGKRWDEEDEEELYSG